jgi:hypothetical protein
MGRGQKEREKDKESKDRERQQAKETAERENRERRLTARAVSQSLQDGLSGAAAAAATAAAFMGTTGGKGAKSAESPPRNSTNEGRESVDAESPAPSKKRRNVRPLEHSSPDHNEEDGTDKSVPASESENEELTTGSKITASNKLKERTGIQVDSIAT